MPSSIDAGIAHIRDEVMPTMQGIDGCIGLSMLVDRQSGRCIATSAWESEDAMRASEEQLRPIRARASEILGGTPQVDEWEIVALHRDHPSREGACVRATWTQVEPAQVDRAIDDFRLTSLPAVEALEGFCSASMMVNRDSGRAVVSVTYDSLAAMERTRDAASTIRAAATEAPGREVLDVGEFELAFAHLRVPEMA